MKNKDERAEELTNEDYKALYLYLFNRVTDTIEQLKSVQQRCEEMYLELGGEGSLHPEKE